MTRDNLMWFRVARYVDGIELNNTPTALSRSRSSIIYDIEIIKIVFYGTEMLRRMFFAVVQSAVRSLFVKNCRIAMRALEFVRKIYYLGSNHGSCSPLARGFHE